MKSDFRPQLMQQAWGVALCACGLAMVYFSQTQLGLLIGMSVIGMGLVFLKRAFWRDHGQIIERKAIKTLSKLSDGWSVDANIVLDGLGDLDALVTHDDGRRIAIEIKSYKSALLKRSMFGRSEELVRGNGRRFEKDPCAQVLKAANAVCATPLLWLPAAEHAKTFHLRNGVVVVLGNINQLRHAIGDKRRWI